MIDWKLFLTKEFWSRKEVSYQYVHFTNALFAAYLVAWLSNGAWYAIFTGLLIGVGVEVWQMLGKTNKLAKMEDRIRDLFFWALGGIIGFIFYL